MAEWIDVNERLPEKAETVLCYCKNTSTELGTMTIGSCDKGWFLQYEVGGTSYPHHYWKVTHWMPLPEPPKEKNDFKE